MFDDVRLPDDIERGAVGGPVFNTEITDLRSGFEQRRAVWSRARQRWDIGYAIQHAVDYHRVRDFFYARQGRFRGFRFKDWSDYSVTDEQFAVADGTSTVYRLVKEYTSGGVTYVRLITRPVMGATASGGGAIDLGTGAVTYGAAPASGTALTWTGEFDVPVRFDVDELNANILHLDALGVPSIPVLEILE